MVDLNDLKSLAILGMATAITANASLVAETIHPAPQSNYLSKGCCRWDDKKMKKMFNHGGLKPLEHHDNQS